MTDRSEIETLVREYDPSNSDWNFRKGVILEVLSRIPDPAQSSLPRTLTAENGAKTALIGEFHEEYHYMDEEGDECTAKIPVSWDTIKRIWVAAVAHFDRTSQLPSTRCTCGGDPGQPADHHDISCPSAISKTERVGK